MGEVRNKDKKDISKLFRSTEELENECAQIQGTIPEWLRGTVVRVGPGKFDFSSDFTVNHWLDGYAVLSKFEIGSNNVKFSKKFLQSDSYKRAMRAQRPVVTEFGTKAYPEKGKGFLARFVSAIMPEMSDNNSSNVFQFGKDFFVSHDSCFFRKIDPCCLGSEERYDSNKLFGLNGLSAHPMTDSNGHSYNIGFSVFPTPKFSIVKIPKEQCKSASRKDMFKNTEVLCTIPSSYNAGISCLHSFGMTEQYIILVEQPYVISASAIAVALVKGYSAKDWLEWRANMRNRFHIFDKRKGRVIKTEFWSNEPFFFLHIVNCSNLNNELVVDIMALDNPDILDGMFLCHLRKSVVKEVAQPTCRRFVIPLPTSAWNEISDGDNLIKNHQNTKATAIRCSNNKIILSPEILTDPGGEMPTINKNFIGKDYTYLYATGSIAKNAFSHSIVKINLKSGETLRWRGTENMYPGEPIMVPKPNSHQEDEGIVITAISNSQEGHQDLLVFIDAKSMKEIARAKFNSQIPGALHGIFIQSAETTRI